MGVMYRAQGAGRLIIVDARAPEAGPGAIYEVAGALLEAAPPRSFNLHDFRWDHALYAGRRIWGGAFPTDVTVILIEAASLGLGLGLTPQHVADRIVALTAVEHPHRLRGWNASGRRNGVRRCRILQTKLTKGKIT